MNLLLRVLKVYSIVLITFVTSCATHSYKDEIVTLNTRPNVTQSFALLVPEGKPKGIILMFPGHRGVVHFEQNGNEVYIDNEHGGLTARPIARDVLRKQGFVVVLLATPSDQQYGIDTEFRMSLQHTTDVTKVLNYLVDRFNQKPYLHGHCRSSYSPASVITDLDNKNVSGLILSSARSRGRWGSVTDLQAGVVKVPVLLIQHKDDPCPGTAYDNFDSVIDFYKSSAKTVDTIEVTGGEISRRSKKKKGRCSGGAHGFKGLEDKVADAIARWIEKKTFPKNINEPEY